MVKSGLPQANQPAWSAKLYGHTHLLTLLIYKVLVAFSVTYLSHSFKQSIPNHS